MDGEVITILLPDDQKSISIKRVIGVTGDRLHFDKKQLYRNGKKVLKVNLYALERCHAFMPYFTCYAKFSPASF